MFDMGFIADLRFILRRLPPQRGASPFLFSATLSFRVLELTWEFMNNPTQITIMPQQKTAERVEQSLYHVGRDEKFPLLLGLLRREGGDRILIFSNTREEARRLEDRLIRNGWETRALTGDVDQKRRLQDPERLQGGASAHPGGDRRRLARAAHRGGDPRRQLGPAAGRRGLRASHRPDRARRRRRQGDRPGRRGECPGARGDREVHRPEDPGRVGGSTICSCRRSSRPRRSAAATPRSAARVSQRATDSAAAAAAAAIAAATGAARTAGRTATRAARTAIRAGRPRRHRPSRPRGRRRSRSAAPPAPSPRARRRSEARRLAAAFTARAVGARRPTGRARRRAGRRESRPG